jgi:hypothetical protein
VRGQRWVLYYCKIDPRLRSPKSATMHNDMTPEHAPLAVDQPGTTSAKSPYVLVVVVAASGFGRCPVLSFGEASRCWKGSYWPSSAAIAPR